MTKIFSKRHLYLTGSVVALMIGLANGETAWADVIWEGDAYTGFGLGGGENIYVGTDYGGFGGYGALTVTDGSAVSGGMGVVGDGGTGTVTITGSDTSGAASMLTLTDDLIVAGGIVASGGSGTVIIEKGGEVKSGVGLIGTGGTTVDANGEVLVTGAGSTWETSFNTVLLWANGILGDLIVGGDYLPNGNGNGTLTISDGGTVKSNTAILAAWDSTTGTVTVTGADSTWANSGSVSVGFGGAGTLEISEGGEVSSKSGSIGDDATATGTATVIGENSSWTNSESLTIGRSGTGTLTIADAGIVSNTTGTIGFNEGTYGTVTVTGDGSRWDNSEYLYVGYNGSGYMTIADGGTVTSGGSYVGGGIFFMEGSGVGDVTVTGAGSTWDTEYLYVGIQGDGTLTVADGGTVTAGSVDLSTPSPWTQNDGTDGTINIGAAAGEAAVGAGNLDTPSLSFGSSAGTLVFNHTDTDYEFAPDIRGVGSIQHLAGTTTLSGDNSGYSGSTTLSGGTLIAGNSSALGTGGVNMSGGTLVGGGTFSLGNDLTVGSGDSATLAATAGNTVTFNGSASFGGASLHFGTEVYDGTVVADFSTVSGKPAQVYVDYGTLQLSAGSEMATGTTLIADELNSNGALVVTGAGSSWAVDSGLIVGREGTGSLTISDSGKVSDMYAMIGAWEGGTGTATVTGTGSTWENALGLSVGTNGTGTLTIEDGGRVSSNGGFLAMNSGSTGSVTVTGAGSAWENSGDLYLSQNGTGTLTIANGGSVSAGTVYIASGSGATGTLNIGTAAGGAAVGAGTLDASSVTFGDGTGTLVFNHTETDYDFAADISGAGAIQHLAGTTTLSGDNSGYSGTTTVSGGTLASTGTLADLSVSGTGAADLAGTVGALSTSDAATVTVSGTLAGTTVDNAGTGGLSVDAGTFTLSGLLSNASSVSVANSATLIAAGVENLSSGTITVAAGGTLTDDLDNFGIVSNVGTYNADVTNDSTGEITNTGTWNGDVLANLGTLTNMGIWNGSVLSNTGLIVLGDGSLITGDVDNTGGTLSVSTVASATIGGTLSAGTVTLQNGATTESLTVNGDYTGGGSLALDVDLAGETSDQLVVNGNVTGVTTVYITDLSSSEANGSDLAFVSVSGTFSADAFVLGTPLSNGIYDYDIEQSGSTYVLASSLTQEVTGLEALPYVMMLQNDLPTLHQRSGYEQSGYNMSLGDSGSVWMLVSSGGSRFSPASSGTGYAGQMDGFRLRGGVSFDVMTVDQGRLTLGGNLSYGTSRSVITTGASSTAIETDTATVALTATWYGTHGLYVDGQAQYGAFENTIGFEGTDTRVDGDGYAGAIEIGKAFAVSQSNWTLTPQARLSYAAVDFDDFTSASGFETTSGDAQSLQAGLGLSADWTVEHGAETAFKLYGSAFVYNELEGALVTAVDGTDITSELADWSGEMTFGARQDFSDGRSSVFVEGTYGTSLTGATAESFSMALGARLAF